MSAARAWTIALPYDHPPISLNSRMHYHKEAQWKRQLRDDAILLARLHKLPRGLRRVLVQLVWTPGTRRTRDSDNPSATLKPLIDGLVAYGLVPDDHAGIVESNCVIRDVAPRKGKMELVITEILADTPK